MDDHYYPSVFSLQPIHLSSYPAFILDTPSKIPYGLQGPSPVQYIHYGRDGRGTWSRIMPGKKVKNRPSSAHPPEKKGLRASVRKFVNKVPVAVRFALAMWLGTRLALTLIGVTGFKLMRSLEEWPYPWKYIEPLWLDIWSLWDSGWYLEIARFGYSTERISDLPKFVEEGQFNYAFFPLYPLFMRWVGMVVGSPYVGGLVVSNVCMIVACFFLYKLVMDQENDESAALRAVKYLFLMPAAFVFTGIFSESMFVMLLLGSFYFAAKRRWFRAGALGFLMCLTRGIGVFMVVPLGFEYLRSIGFNFRDFAETIRPRGFGPGNVLGGAGRFCWNNLMKVRANFLLLLLVPAGFFVYYGYIHVSTQGRLSYFSVQKAVGWYLTGTNPLILLYESFVRPHWMFQFFGALFSSLGLLALAASFRRLRFSHFVAGVLLILVPLCSGQAKLLSMQRFLIVVFPLMIVCALGTRKRSVDAMLTVMLALIQGFLMLLWCVFWFTKMVV